MELSKQDKRRVWKQITNHTPSHFNEEGLQKFENGGVAAGLQYNYNWKPAVLEGYPAANTTQNSANPGINWDAANQMKPVSMQEAAANGGLDPNKGVGLPIDVQKKQLDQKVNNADIKVRNINFGSNGSSDSAASAIHPGFAIGAWLGGGVLEGINSIKNKDELLNEAGMSQGNIGGIQYDKQNLLDTGKIMSEYDKSTAKSFLTNPGRGLAKLFGRGEQERQLKEAALTAGRRNDFAYANALGQKNRIDYLAKHGSQDNQTLTAKNGKLPRFSNGANAVVSPGETILRKIGNNYYMEEIPGSPVHKNGKPNKKDNVKTWLNPGDGVVSNNHGPDGIPNSKYVVMTGDIRGGFARDEYSRAANGIYKAKNGKLPKFAEGWLNNAIPSGLGMLASLDQYWDAASQRIRIPNSYRANPYETSALEDLAGLRISTVPIVDKIESARAAANYGIDQLGGLSTGQKARYKTQNLLNTQRNIAGLLTNAQMQNNQYRTQLANAKMSLGAQRAQRAMQAYMFDEEMTAKAHASRQQGKQMGIYNALNQLQGYYANEFKRRQFNDTMDLYRQQHQLDENALKFYTTNWGKSSAPDYYVHESPLSVQQMKSIGALQAMPQYEPEDYLKKLRRFNFKLR